MAESKDAVRTEPGPSPEEHAASILNRASSQGNEIIDFTGRAGRHPNGCVCKGCESKRGGAKPVSRGRTAPPRSNRNVARVEPIAEVPPNPPLTELEIETLTKEVAPLTYLGMAYPINKSFPDEPYTMDEATDLTKAGIPVLAKWGGGSLAAFAPELTLLAVGLGQVMGRLINKVEKERQARIAAGATGTDVSKIADNA